jgi:SAM-dependent methyltransferase
VTKPDYGIDAPDVVRNLLVAAGALFLVAGASLLGLLPRLLTLHPIEALDIRIPIASTAFWTASALSVTGCWMYLGSRFGKVRERERLLDHVTWKGDEQVLDVGCGRGLLLVGAARRLKTGAAIGVDIWQKEDLSGNRAEVPLQNAAIEGVADRVAVRTADMRRLPFESASFDVVISRAAIHNLYAAPDREAAIREIARVLKPGGRAVISDIRHLQEYARTFAGNGCRDTRYVGSWIVAAACALLTMGSLRPNTMLVQKTG